MTDKTNPINICHSSNMEREECLAFALPHSNMKWPMLGYPSVCKSQLCHVGQFTPSKGEGCTKSFQKKDRNGKRGTLALAWVRSARVSQPLQCRQGTTNSQSEQSISKTGRRSRRREYPSAVAHQTSDFVHPNDKEAQFLAGPGRANVTRGAGRSGWTPALPRAAMSGSFYNSIPPTSREAMPFLKCSSHIHHLHIYHLAGPCSNPFRIGLFLSLFHSVLHLSFFPLGFHLTSWVCWVSFWFSDTNTPSTSLRPTTPADPHTKTQRCMPHYSSCRGCSPPPGLPPPILKSRMFPSRKTSAPSPTTSTSSPARSKKAGNWPLPQPATSPKSLSQPVRALSPLPSTPPSKTSP